MVNSGKILATILEREGLDVPQLAHKIGVTCQGLNSILRGRTKKLSYRLREKILLAFPDLSPRWLSTGEGEMFQRKQQSIVQTIGDGSNNNTQTATTDRLANEIAELRVIIAQQQQQMNTLLAIIDRLTTNI